MLTTRLPSGRQVCHQTTEREDDHAVGQQDGRDAHQQRRGGDSQHEAAHDSAPSVMAGMASEPSTPSAHSLPSGVVVTVR